MKFKLPPKLFSYQSYLKLIRSVCAAKTYNTPPFPRLLVLVKDENSSDKFLFIQLLKKIKQKVYLFYMYFLQQAD